MDNSTEIIEREQQVLTFMHFQFCRLWKSDWNGEK